MLKGLKIPLSAAALLMLVALFTGGAANANCPDPFCDSISAPACMNICPTGDVTYSIFVKDSCGNPVCDPLAYLDFAACAATPCPDQPDWPLVYPDSCDPTTGEHIFRVKAGSQDCIDCSVPLVVGGTYCRDIRVRFFDINADLCVTVDDYLGQLPCNDYNCDNVIDNQDAVIFNSHLDHCCDTQPCDPGVPFCDSTIFDPCLVICPLGDIPYEVVVRDNCGNPVCDLTSTWIEMSPNCPAQPCPNQPWPQIYPDSCDPVTGKMFFNIKAGALDCITCTATLYVGGLPCKTLQVKFLDINGDLCVKDDDWVGADCNDYNCDGFVDAATDMAIHNAHLDHCCGTQPCDPGPAFCDSTLVPSNCWVACPLDDITYRVIAKDSCGNPVCDPNMYLQVNAGCPAQPCPDQPWPKIYPDSCDPASGSHFFSIAASAPDCLDCGAVLYVNGQPCRDIILKFLDLTGDFCVLQDDWMDQFCNDYNCDGVVDATDMNFFNLHLDHCCGTQPCDPGPPFCDSTVFDPCLVICPLGDNLYTVGIKDSCGNPICDMNGTWIEISPNCPAQPCPNQPWPQIYPDSCDPVTGKHFFNIAAGAFDCLSCTATIFVNGAACKTVAVKFLDIDGDLCVTDNDWIGQDCNDYNCDGAVDATDMGIHNAHLDHCCSTPPCDPGPPYCDSTYVPDLCWTVCPLDDITYSVFVMDSCGNPICDPNLYLLVNSGCPAQPCPNQSWPQIFPDSCDPATGEHFFSIAASAPDCLDCGAVLYVNGQPCRDIILKFLDLTGDFCVTQADWFGQVCNDYNCDGAADAVDMNFFNQHIDHCCGTQPCDPGPPFCDSIVYDPCMLVCPLGDAIYTVGLKDSCGNPICDPNMFIELQNCPAVPCPNAHPDWPVIYPDSCDPVTGKHFFNVKASAPDCFDCTGIIFVNGLPCRDVIVKFLDVNGDFCVHDDDFIVGASCSDYNCDGTVDATDQGIHAAHFNHCCASIPCDSGIPFCDSVVADPCIPICPLDDEVYIVTIKDSCGMPLCDPNCWLDFSQCQAIPCPTEVNWPLVYPDSCHAATGEHFFSVAASIPDCIDCRVWLYVNGKQCRVLAGRFFDINGDFCVTGNDYLPALPCNDYDCDNVLTAADQTIFAAHLDHCCQADTCDNQFPGDANGDGAIDLNDVTYLKDYINGVGPAPVPQANGDPNGDCCIDEADVQYLLDYLSGAGPAPVNCTCVNPVLCDCRPGDANNDGSVNVGDAVYIINYVFNGGPGPGPYPVCSGDANCDCLSNVGDAVFIVNYVFNGGPPPCTCCEWAANCGYPPYK